MKTKIFIALLVGTMLVLTTKLSARDIADPDGKHVRKQRSAIPISPDRWNDSLVERDVNGNIIPDNYDDGSFRIDSSSVYFKMMERNKKLPSGASWDGTSHTRIMQYGINSEFGYSRRKEQ